MMSLVTTLFGSGLAGVLLAGGGALVAVWPLIESKSTSKMSVELGPIFAPLPVAP